MADNNTMQVEDNSALELITRLRNQGVSLSKEEGQLRFKAPQGLLKESDIETLKYFKADILELLQAESEPVAVVPAPESRFDAFPLTDVQAAYLLGRSNAFEYGGVACHIYLELKYPDLDPKRVVSIWNQLIERHDMLRATISQEGQQQVQAQVPNIEVDYLDASGFDEKNLSTSLEKVRQEMGHRVYETDKWPLFGVAITKTQEYSILHFSIEFLIADGASVWFLLGEFEDLYYETGRRLPDLELTFRDYVLAEKRMKSGTAYSRDKQYWLDRIDELPAAPELPLQINQDYQKSPRFSRHLFFLEGDDWSAFKSRVQKHGVTATSAVLAAYSAVLERWSKSSSFCLNMTVLNRQPLHRQVYEIVGDFTSVSMLEVNWSDEGTFQDQAKKLNTQLFTDLDHRLFSGVEVLREVARRKGREAALMPIVFTSAIGLAHADTSYTLKGELLGDSISQTPQVFIDCQATDTENGIKINWDIREGIFPEKLIEDMFRAFEELVMSLASEDEVWQRKVALPLPEYQRVERQKANDTQAPLPTGLLHSKVVESIKNNGSRTAIIDKDGAVVSYKELGQKAASVAERLRELGCEAQERVAIVLGKGANQIAAVLGVLANQAVYVPIDLGQPEVRRSAILEQAGIRFVLTDSNTGIGWPERISAIEVDQLTPSSVDQLDLAGDPNFPAYIIFTSGSTGVPKGVVISHTAALNTIEDINERYEVSENDSILSLAQLGFDLSVYDIFGLLSVGGKLVFPKDERATDPSHWAQLIQKYEISLWNSVPALMQMLSSYLSSEKDIQLQTLRRALLSGDWIPINLPDQITGQVPSVRVVSLGGATEASIWSIFHEYEKLQPGWSSIPYGRPLRNQAFRVLNSSMQDCPVWVAGELHIAGAGLAQEYFGDKQITDASFFNHPNDGQRLYKTGDLGRYLPGGEIEFLGREDNQVKIRGHRIELGEIEATLQKHDGVATACVVVDGTGEDRSLLGIVETAQKETNYAHHQAELERLVERVDESVTEPGCYLDALLKQISMSMPSDPLKILQLNGEPESATSSVINAFEGRDIDFLVTHSEVESVTKTQALFAECKGVKCMVLDISQDYRHQGLEPNSYDFVLVSVSNREISDIRLAISHLTKVLRPNGYLVVTDGSETSFATKGESDKFVRHWYDLLRNSFDGQPTWCSLQNNTVSDCDFVFVAKVKTDRVNINSLELTEFIAQHLPAYMTPTHLQVADALPLTANGKVDRKKLTHWRPSVIESCGSTGEEEHDMDELESRLAQLWVSALGISHLAKTQSVYDLGVDSLVMAKVAGDVRQFLSESDAWSVDISFDNLLRHMLNFPTIEGLAKFIRSQQSEQVTLTGSEKIKQANDSDSNAVLTHFGGGNEGPLRVVFHAGLGTLNSYVPLLEYMAEQQMGSTVGVSIKNVDDYCELNSEEAIEHIAEDYATQIAKLDKDEVQLVGHCLGGFTAFEVARRLLERGIDVLDLTLVDSHPMKRVEDDWILEIVFVSAGGVSMERCGFPGITVAEIKEAMGAILAENPERIPHGAALSVGGNEVLDKVRRMFQKLNTMSMRDRFSTYAAAMDNVHGNDMPVEMLEGMYRAYNQSFKAAQMTPLPYLGNARYLLAEESFSFIPVCDEHSLSFWRDIVLGDFEVSKITGNHDTCVEQEPHVTKLAKIVGEHLLKGKLL